MDIKRAVSYLILPDIAQFLGELCHCGISSGPGWSLNNHQISHLESWCVLSDISTPEFNKYYRLRISSIRILF